MKALLVIDMQEGCFTPETPRYDAGMVVLRINKLSSGIRKKGDKVIFIQHNGSRDDYLIPGAPDWEILPEIEIGSEDVMVSKTANDSFYQTNLRSVLDENQIDELIITGCATDFCVDSTVKTAFNMDYKVTVVKDAHTTTDRPHLDAITIIRHYNWIWENMIETTGKIRVASTGDLLKEMELS